MRTCVQFRVVAHVHVHAHTDIHVRIDACLAAQTEPAAEQMPGVLLLTHSTTTQPEDREEWDASSPSDSSIVPRQQAGSQASASCVDADGE